MSSRAVWLMLLLGACERGDDPKWGGKCDPKPGRDGITCTLENQGKKAGRACLTLRVISDKGPIPSRRTCTGVVAPGASATLTPIIERSLDVCSKSFDWVCPIEIIENSRQLGENVPPESTGSAVR